jgi:hypothetical protein
VRSKNGRFNPPDHPEGGKMKKLEQETFDRLIRLEEAFEKLLQLFSRPIQQEIEDILTKEA